MALDRRTLSLVLPLLAAACGPRLPPSSADGETSVGDDLTDTDTPTDDDTDTGETSTTATTSTSTDGSTFFWPPDMPGPPPDCDPFLQDCPDGEKCVAYSTDGGLWNANKCVPVTGDQAPGEPCIWGGTVEATDDCDQTSACWETNEDAIGICRAFCSGSGDDPSCPEAQICLISSNGATAHCVPQCDPIAQDCNDGLACFWASNAFHCIFTTENLAPGEPCGFINDCAGGLMCMEAETLPDCDDDACCTPFCDLELGDGQCDAVPGTVCVAMFEANTAPAGYDEVGRCLAP